MNEAITALKNAVLKPESELGLDVIDRLKEAGIQVFYVNGEAVTGKAECLDAFARAMNFPDYFGHNWDAFEDCLTDLAWCPAEEYIVVYDRTDRFADANPEDFRVAQETLKSAESYWAQKKSPMRVVLVSGKTVFKKG